MITSRQILALVAVSCSIATVAAAQAACVPAGTVAVPGTTGTVTQLGGPSSGTNLVLNGDFESYSGGPCDTDLTNAAFTAMMAGATGFGTAEEIDVYTGGSCDGSGIPSGERKVCIRRQSDGDSDAFSLALATPILAGDSYTLSFLARNPYGSGVLGRVQVGISDSATSFGTPVFTSALPIDWWWFLITATFVAPVDASFLTVSEEQVDAWTHLDDFTLVPPGLGSKYCLASWSSYLGPADISASGSASSSAGDLILTAIPVANMPGVFFHGTYQTQAPFGYGYLCASGQIVRGPVKVATGNVATITYDNFNSTRSLAAFVGSTRHFQYWFRACGFASSCYFTTSNAISIAIEP